jgi:NitT/TauT family transport system permease protein
MSLSRLPWQAALAVILAVAAALGLPLLKPELAAFTPMETALVFALILAAVVASISPISRALCAAILLIDAHAAAALLLTGVARTEDAARAGGAARLSFFLLLAASWLLAWLCVALLSDMRPASRHMRTFLRLLIPFIFGVWILIIWEAVTRGAGVPFILLPPPSAVGARFVEAYDQLRHGVTPNLVADARQTILKAVLFGFVVGSGAGFLAAIMADRFDFLRRGLLPIGNMVSALPIIGVAPIMVMWFGFDWQSKAAVVVIMTFFPMLVNTVAGLAASGHIERDLMHTYASDYWQTLRKLRLPTAAPFIFNALKINSTLAMIGAIVAEFFGTPTVGMGFRISTEVGRMNIDMVWAEIAVAALAGSVFYGVVALIERATTFWHPSMRGG